MQEELGFLVVLDTLLERSLCVFSFHKMSKLCFKMGYCCEIKQVLCFLYFFVFFVFFCIFQKISHFAPFLQISEVRPPCCCYFLQVFCDNFEAVSSSLAFCLFSS